MKLNFSQTVIGLVLSSSFCAIADARLSHRKLDANVETIPYPDPTHFPSPCLNLPAGRVHDGTSQWGWELVPFCNGDCIHGQGQVATLPLRFPMTVSGQTVTTATIYDHGVVCLGRACIYAYYSEVDTSRLHTVHVNHIWYSSGPHGFSVIWDHVEGARSPPGLFNTFQVLISDGTVETMGDSNVCTCYDTMEWPDPRNGQVGFIDDFSATMFWFGIFSLPNDSYSGPNFDAPHDGTGYLEGRAFCYNIESSLRPPIAVGFPDFPLGSSTFQLKTCGSPGEVNLAFYFIPGNYESSVYEVTVNGDIPEGMLVDIAPFLEQSYFVYVRWENIYPVDPFELEFVARDDNSPSSLVTRKSIYVEVEDDCPDTGLEVNDTEPTSTTTIRPTTLEPKQEEELEDIVTEVPAASTVFPTTEEPTDTPTEDPTEAVITSSVCDDEVSTTFDVAGSQKTCAWLRARLEDLVTTSNDIPTIPAEWDGLLWSEALCGNEENPGVAHVICEESCGHCEDDCEDQHAFYLANGAEYSCRWLWTHVNQIDKYCDDVVSDANTRCPETCGTCDNYLENDI